MVVIRMRVRRQETCESALETFDPSGFEKKISSFLRVFLCEIDPCFCGKERYFDVFCHILIGFENSKNVKITLLTAKARENFAQKKSQKT